VDVVGAEHVAGAVAAVERRPVALGAAGRCPAGAVGWSQRDRPHLVDGDHRRALRSPLVERQYPLRLGGVVGVRARLPRPRALERQARLSQQSAEMGGRDLDDPFARQPQREARQRPARERHPLAVGTGAGHRDDPLALLGGDPAGTPAPIVRAQRVQPPLVELVDHLPHVRLVGHPHPRDLRCRHACVRRQQDRRSLTRRLVLRLLGEPLQPHRLLVRQRPHKHLRGTHHHLQARVHTSLVVSDQEFPVERLEKPH
jgi:hypothetical protein